MTYAPRPGSLPDKAITLLKEEGELPIAVLAERVGLDINTVKAGLIVPINFGVLKRLRHPTSGCWIYSVGDGIPLRAGGDGDPIQRTVAANETSPGLDIDAIHRNRPWCQTLTEDQPGFACALVPGSRLRLMVAGRSDLILTAAQTKTLRNFLASNP